MPLIRVPDSDKAIIQNLARFTTEELTYLLNALNSDVIQPYGAAMTDSLPMGLELHEINSSELIRVLFTMYVSWKNSDYDAEDYIEGLIDAVASELNQDDKKTLEDNLTYIINSNSSLSVTTNALDLYSRQKKVLEDFKLYTDIRPAFSKFNDLEIEYNIVFHNLEISYYEDGDLKRDYVTLNSSDLRLLLGALERAKKKEEIIKKEYEGRTKLYSIEG